ncbi:MAG TPA: DUF2203 domain-containing protein [Thermomicrobiales bacterium]|nr:DUF2203 domain-containing protein [Thermomicrobiales bacterium]
MDPLATPDPNDPASWPRLFTLAEANALLARLAPLLSRLRADKAALDDARSRLAKLTPSMRGNGHAADAMELEGQIDHYARTIAAGIREVVGQGIDLKDIDRGLIDFPSPREGRVVYLCWHLGERHIRYWHEVDAGFAGRQPLADEGGGGGG